MVFKCHNCGVGRTLPNFLKDQAPDLHDEYIMERYKTGTTGKGSYVPKPKFEKPVFKKKGQLRSVAELNNDHPATGYLLGRQIPKQFLKKFTTQKTSQYGLTHKNHVLRRSLAITHESLSRLSEETANGLDSKEDPSDPTTLSDT